MNKLDFRIMHDRVNDIKLTLDRLSESNKRMNELLSETIFLRTKPIINVVCGIIVDTYGDILLGLRSNSMEYPGYWEFPGGKVEYGERFEQAIVREIKEELGTDFNICSWLDDVRYEYEDIIIDLHAYIGYVDNYYCLEHEKLELFSLEQLEHLNMLPPNKILVKELLNSVKFYNKFYNMKSVD